MHVPPTPTSRSRRRPWLRCGTIGALVLALSLPATAATAAPAPGYLTDPDSEPGDYLELNIGADRTAANYFYRIPALAHLGDGVVIAAWDARPGSAADAPNPNSIIQRRSTDNGRTWGPLQIIAAGKTGSDRYGYSDPSYVVDRESGRVFAFFVHSKDQGFQGSAYGDDDANRQILGAAVIHSDDGGETWSAPRLITDVVKTSNGTLSDGAYSPVTGDVKGTFATSGEGIQLRYGEHAGRLLQQYAGTVRQSDGSTAIQAYSVYSDDGGQTWERGEYVGTGMDENKVVELSDGRVMLNSRDSSNGRLRKVAISTDGGHSYGPVIRDAELPDPTNNASITRLHPEAAEGTDDAKKLIFTNANNGANGNRVNGAVRLSCDDGETWPGLRTLETGTFAYSSATAIDEGRVGVLWEAGYTDTMQFSSFDEDWMNAVCAPLSVPTTALTAGAAAAVPVEVTNQEETPLNGAVTLHTTAGWAATTAQVVDLAPGATTTVELQVTAPQGAAGSQRLQAAFTAADGRLSQTTATFTLPQESVLGATLTSTNTSAARNVVTNPYTAGEQLSFQVRVVSTAGVTTVVTPAANTFTTGFAPTACRWLSLPAHDAYNCNSPRRTLTQADIDRGWYTPEFAFTVAPADGSAPAVTVTHSAAPVVLRDGVLAATITGGRGDAGRDLESSPYAVGEQVPYAFRVDNDSPTAVTVVPETGDFSPFLPPAAGNCRYRNLPFGAGYDCGTARHTVTQADIDRGFFIADTTWTVEAAGQSTTQLAVPGGEKST
ncbi:sialidase family protein [Microbacterium paraoxydans]|uniref:sialidase family protein n=1 Tax=Microbacterium paraoxydans TaxID=199592 RepID=UPI001CFC432E|nr:sialidase family protein [Microbacterium paraoxydans]